jgi:hypothetical protein
MFKFIKSRMTKAISAAVLAMSFGLGMTGPGFAAAMPPGNPFGVQTPSAPGDVLTPQTLGTLLQSLNIGVNTTNDNGTIEYQITVPAKNGSPAVTIVLAIAPNTKFVNLWYVAGQFDQQSAPTQQVLMTLLEASDKLCPAYVDIENNLVVLRDNIANKGLTADDLMAELKAFYADVQAIQQDMPAQPQQNQPTPNPFG